MKQQRCVMLASTDEYFLRGVGAAIETQWPELTVAFVRSLGLAKELLASSSEQLQWVIVTWHLPPLGWDAMAFTLETKKIFPAVKVVLVAPEEFGPAASRAGADEFCDCFAEDNLGLVIQAVARHLE